MKSLKLTAVLLAVCVMQGENFKIFLSAFVEFFPRGGALKGHRFADISISRQRLKSRP